MPMPALHFTRPLCVYGPFGKSETFLQQTKQEAQRHRDTAQHFVTYSQD